MDKTTLTPKMILAAATIAMGGTHKQAANAAKVISGTVSTWMQNPEFVVKIAELQKANLEQAQNKFRHLAVSAVDTMSELMATAKNEKVKLEAAKYVLDTIKIAPDKETGLWFVGPTNMDDLETHESIKAMWQRLKFYE